MKSLRHLQPILLLFCSLLWPATGAAAPSAAERNDPDFPLPERLIPAVDFWQRVYLDATTKQGFLHDSRRLGVIYELVDLGNRSSSRSRQRHIDKRRKHWRGVLRKLSRQVSGGIPGVGRLLPRVAHPPPPQETLT